VCEIIYDKSVTNSPNTVSDGVDNDDDAKQVDDGGAGTISLKVTNVKYFSPIMQVSNIKKTIYAIIKNWTGLKEQNIGLFVETPNGMVLYKFKLDEQVEQKIQDFILYKFAVLLNNSFKNKKKKKKPHLDNFAE